MQNLGYAEPRGRLRITRYVLEQMTQSEAALSSSVLTKIFFAATQRFLNEPVEEIRVAAGSIIKTVIEKQVGVFVSPIVGMHMNRG